MAISVYDVKRLTLEEDCSDVEELHYNFKVRYQSINHRLPRHCGGVSTWVAKILLLLLQFAGSQEARSPAHLHLPQTAECRVQ